MNAIYHHSTTPCSAVIVTELSLSPSCQEQFLLLSSQPSEQCYYRGFVDLSSQRSPLEAAVITLLGEHSASQLSHNELANCSRTLCSACSLELETAAGQRGASMKAHAVPTVFPLRKG